MNSAINNKRLGVNIDHVATLRQLRNTPYPSIVEAARAVIRGGADQITVHLREDRRHINDEDVFALKKSIGATDLNLEMAATEEMLSIALKLKPHSICLVPEKREERTTEGGLDLTSDKDGRLGLIRKITEKARSQGIVVSYFIEPEIEDIEKAHQWGAHAVELHTGSLCIAFQKDFIGKRPEFQAQWKKLNAALNHKWPKELLIHAGHGIDYHFAPMIGALETIVEFNIGHAIVCEAVFFGLEEATKRMKCALWPEKNN